MTKRKPEVTSKRVAAIAGRVLPQLRRYLPTAEVHVVYGRPDGYGSRPAQQVLTVSELRALCASALTQAEGKK